MPAFFSSSFVLSVARLCLSRSARLGITHGSASGGAHVCCAGIRNGMTTAATSATWRLKWEIAKRKARKRLRLMR